MKRKIIGICGFIGCGKGAVGDILVDEYGFTKISFADKLKDGVSTIFGWDRNALEGDTKESREWREHPDEFWSTELGRDITPRHVLQLFGTDCIRRGFDEQVWVLTVKREIQKNPTVDYVLPDVRFYNERDMIRDLEGEVWRVKRGQDPEWVQKAINDNRYNTVWMEDYLDVHESEYRWLDHPSEFERTIPNDSKLEELVAEVQKAINN